MTLQQRITVGLKRNLTPANFAPEYNFKWKEWEIDGGESIPALRASANKQAKIIGWPSPNTPSGGPNTKSTSTHTGGIDLEGAVTQLSAWPTPRIPNGGRRPKLDSLSVDGQTPDGKRQQVDIEFIARSIAGWASPTTRDWKDSPGMSMESVNPDGSKRERNDLLPRQVYEVEQCKEKASGATTDSSDQIPKGVSAGLAAELPSWLMAYPESHLECAPSWKEWELVQSMLKKSSNEQELIEMALSVESEMR